MIRKLEEKDRQLYIEMAREFYHSDAVLHPVPDSHFEKTAAEALSGGGCAEEPRPVPLCHYVQRSTGDGY